MSAYEDHEEYYLQEIAEEALRDNDPSVWISHDGLIQVSDMQLGHLKNAVALCERKGYKFPALGTMRARIKLLEGPPELPFKTMPIQEFRECGALQEINRQLLHPMGLALFATGEANGSFTGLGVMDNRGDPEGMIYDQDYLQENIARFAAKRDLFYRLLIERSEARRKLIGSVIQHIPPTELID